MVIVTRHIRKKGRLDLTAKKHSLKGVLPIICHYSIYSFTIILRAIANSSDKNENLLDDTDLRFSIQLFSCWDYKISNPETADNKLASIATAFRETILEEEESGKSQDQNIWSTRCLRLTATTLVFIFLGGSGWIIYDIVMVSKFKQLCLESQHSKFGISLSRKGWSICAILSFSANQLSLK